MPLLSLKPLAMDLFSKVDKWDCYVFIKRWKQIAYSILGGGNLVETVVVPLEEKGLELPLGHSEGESCLHKGRSSFHCPLGLQKVTLCWSEK